MKTPKIYSLVLIAFIFLGINVYAQEDQDIGTSREK